MSQFSGHQCQGLSHVLAACVRVRGLGSPTCSVPSTGTLASMQRGSEDPQDRGHMTMLRKLPCLLAPTPSELCNAKTCLHGSTRNSCYQYEMIFTTTLHWQCKISKALTLQCPTLLHLLAQVTQDSPVTTCTKKITAMTTFISGRGQYRKFRSRCDYYRYNHDE